MEGAQRSASRTPLPGAHPAGAIPRATPTPITVVLDSAHNPVASRSLAKLLADRFPVHFGNRESANAGTFGGQCKDNSHASATSDLGMQHGDGKANEGFTHPVCRLVIGLSSDRSP